MAWGVGDTHFTDRHIEGIHISLGICVLGYTYHGDTFLLFSTDRDECSVKDSCPLANSYCVNTFGSFKCLCNKGYKEVYDAKKNLLKCQGMVTIVAVTSLH